MKLGYGPVVPNPTAEHIEFVHERDLGGMDPDDPELSVKLARMHVDMHRERDDWGHTHRRGQLEPVWDDAGD